MAINGGIAKLQASGRNKYDRWVQIGCRCRGVAQNQFFGRGSRTRSKNFPTAAVMSPVEQPDRPSYRILPPANCRTPDVVPLLQADTAAAGWLDLPKAPALPDPVGQ